MTKIFFLFSISVFTLVALADFSYAQWVKKVEGDHLSSVHAGNETIISTKIDLEDTRTGHKISIDGRDFFLGDIIADFLQIAFSDKLWNEDADSVREDGFGRMIDWYSSYDWKLDNPAVEKKYETIKEKFPWIADFVYQPNGFPRHNAINKWGHSITVAFGWPGTKGSDTQNYRFIAEAITEIFPELTNASGLSVRILNGDEAHQETQGNAAKIRIVLADVWPSRNWLGVSDYQYDVYSYEEGFLGGVPIEMGDKSQVDAYILPDHKNEIGMVICKIKNNISVDRIKQLSKMCMVKALGIPGSFKTRADSVFSKRPMIQEHLTAYDRLMIKMLYCKTILPGMDKNQVLRTLASSPECLQ
jgi:hypothetical protein